MRRLFFPHTTQLSNAVVSWVANILDEPVDLFHDPYAYCVADHEKILAGFILHDYSTHNVTMSIAIAPGTILSPALVHDVMRVPFEAPMDACRVSAFVDETNLRSVRLIQQIGFVEEGRIRKHFGDHDALVFGLLREEFYGGRYGSRREKRRQQADAERELIRSQRDVAYSVQ